MAKFAVLVPAVLIIAAAVVIALALNGTSAPAIGAAAVVPGDALAYVHLSTDPSRSAVKQAEALGNRFPGYPLLSAAVENRLSAIAGGGRTDVSYRRDIRPWLGNEAALALLNTTGATAGSEMILGVKRHAAAQSFLTSAGAVTAGAYRGTALYAYRSGTEVAFVSHYLVLGQPASVRAAIDVADGQRQSLSATSTYRKAAAGEPDDRVLDAYVSAAGLQRVLLPRGGLVGALGQLLYQPALTATTMSVSPAAGGAKVRLHGAIEARLERGAGPPAQAFEPTLQRVMPAGSLLMIDTDGLARIAGRVLRAAATGGIASNLGPLLGRLGTALQSEGVNVQGVESLFDGETAVAVGPGSTARGAGRAVSPSLLIVTHTKDQSAATTQLAELELPLSQLFPAPQSGSGAVPEFFDRQVGGVTAHQLALAPGLELDYAVFRGLIVISTSLGGIGAVASHAHPLADEAAWKAAFGSNPGAVTSLVFLDFNQLLSLAGQTGLFRGALYSELRPDLQKVRAVGLSSTRGEADSTAELFLQIP